MHNFVLWRFSPSFSLFILSFFSTYLLLVDEFFFSFLKLIILCRQLVFFSMHASFFFCYISIFFSTLVLYLFYFIPILVFSVLFNYFVNKLHIIWHYFSSFMRCDLLFLFLASLITFFLLIIYKEFIDLNDIKMSEFIEIHQSILWLNYEYLRHSSLIYWKTDKTNNVNQPIYVILVILN